MAEKRVAVVGSGYWGKNLVRNFHELGALACVCESDPAKKSELLKQYLDLDVRESYDDVLSDLKISAVVISTPAESHARMVKAALLAGKDVFVEKPLALSAEVGETLVQLAKQKKRILMVGHLLWYHPAVLKLKELIENGELGRIQYIYSTRLNLGKIRKEENILWSFAPHDISVILGLVDEMPSEIKALGGNYLQPSVTDVTVSLLSFPSGVKAHIFVSWLHPFKEQKLVVVGDHKMAVFDDIEKDHKLMVYPHAIEWKHQLPVVNKAEAQPVPFEMHEPLKAECEHFLSCINGRATPRTDGDEALRVLKVLQQCQMALTAPSHRSSAHVSAQPAASYFAHDSAFIDKNVEIGKGTSIWHVSHILEGSKIGAHCKIGQNVVIGPRVVIGDGVKIQNNISIYEGVTIEDHVFCGPSMVFTNVLNPRSEIPRMKELKKTLVRQGATLGANCTIVCGVTIGAYSFVGAGAVVTRDIPDYALVVGNPARFAGWMCSCGFKLKKSGKVWSCLKCSSRYQEAKGKLRALATARAK